MSRRVWARLRVAGGLVILALVAWRLGTGPFVDGLRRVDAGAVIAAVAITGVTTTAAAWRWCLVARGLGVHLALPPAIAAYYRSQLLNSTLPGGVVGDVHRGVSHGQQAGDLGRGLRAVGWERGAGQAVQLAVAMLVLSAFPSPVQAAMPVVVAVVVSVAAAVVVVTIAVHRRGGRRPARARSRWSAIVGATRADVKDGLLARPIWPGVLLSSFVVAAGHTATFLIAARVAGSSASLDRLLPLAMLVLLAMTVPLSVGGWGPREGVAAWVFGAAGLGAGTGVATATVYGVMGLVACLPGVVVLLAPHVVNRRRPAPPPPADPLVAAGSSELIGASRG